MNRFAATLALAFILACQGGTSRTDGQDGARGPQGPQGEKGDKGDKGDPGSPGTGGSALHASGTRIKARFDSTPDGAKQFVGWYDSNKDVDCSFVLASDGSRRCMPAEWYFSFYSDAACTQGVIQTAKGCAGPGQLVSAYKQSIACGTSSLRFSAHTIAGPNTSGSLYFVDSKGTCEVTSRDPNMDYWAISSALPASDFAQVTTSRE